MESVRGEQAVQDVCEGPSDKTQGCAEQGDVHRENTELFNNV